MKILEEMGKLLIQKKKKVYGQMRLHGFTNEKKKRELSEKEHEEYEKLKKEIENI